MTNPRCFPGTTFFMGGFSILMLEIGEKFVSPCATSDRELFGYAIRLTDYTPFSATVLTKETEGKCVLLDLLI